MLSLLREHGYSIVEGAEHGEVLLERKDRQADSTVAVSVEAVEKKQESSFRDSDKVGELPLQQILQNSPDAIVVTRIDDGVVLDSNESFAELTGYGHGEMLGQNFLGLVFFLNPEFWTRAFRRLEAEGEIRDLETRIWKKEGLVTFVLVSLRRVEIAGMPCHVITIRECSHNSSDETHGGRHVPRDTELKNILSPDVDINREEVGRLIDFEAIQDLMNSFYKITRIGIGINDLKGNVQVATGWQDVCTKFFRINPEALKNCLESDIYLSQKLGQGEAIYKCKHGVWELATPLVVGGRHIANIFLGQFFFEDETPDYQFFRKQAEQYGFNVEEFLAALDRVPRWSHELVHNVMEFYSKLAMLISRLSIGNIQLSQALVQQKRISEELRQANLVVENSPVVLFRWRAEEGWPVELVSANVTRFGYTQEELLNGSVSFASLVHPDDLEWVASEVAEYTATGIDSFQQEYRIVTKEGVVRWIDDRTVIERDAEGRATYYQGIVIDITERRLAEDARREIEEKFRVLAETAPTGIIVYQGAHFVYVNPSTVRLFGYSETELLGMHFWEWAHPDQREMVMNRGMARQRGEQVPAQYENRFVKKNGEEGWVIVSAGSIEYQGKPAGIATFVDITETKRAEERISAALAEKVVLLKEVHHRVKNNLQIISSLLDLQSESLRDGETLGIFRESQNRIQAMALIHQKLYQSESFTFIDLREYIEELSRYLYSASVKDPDLIHLTIEAGEVSLGMDEAIPCGLIINELISNSLKHAFPEGRSGEISIRCGIEDGWIVLAVSDTGIGLPLGLDAGCTETLGLQLVTMLVKQLRGRITVGREQAGTVFFITFPGSSHEGARKV